MIFRAFTGLSIAVSLAVMALGAALILDVDNRAVDVLLPWAVVVSGVLTASVVVCSTRKQESSDPSR